MLDEQIAVRLVAMGAVYPSDGLLWAAARAPKLVTSNSPLVECIARDPALNGHGVRLSQTVAQALGRDRELSVETARALLDLLGRSESVTRDPVG